MILLSCSNYDKGWAFGLFSASAECKGMHTYAERTRVRSGVQTKAQASFLRHRQPYRLSHHFQSEISRSCTFTTGTLRQKNCAVICFFVRALTWQKRKFAQKMYLNLSCCMYAYLATHTHTHTRTHAHTRTHTHTHTHTWIHHTC